MDIIEFLVEKFKFEFNFKFVRVVGKVIFEINDLVIGYDFFFIKLLNLYMERG